jgi:hypothetical protein
VAGPAGGERGWGGRVVGRAGVRGGGRRGRGVRGSSGRRARRHWRQGRPTLEVGGGRAAGVG